MPGLEYHCSRTLPVKHQVVVAGRNVSTWGNDSRLVNSLAVVYDVNNNPGPYRDRALATRDATAIKAGCDWSVFASLWLRWWRLVTIRLSSPNADCRSINQYGE